MKLTGPSERATDFLRSNEKTESPILRRSQPKSPSNGRNWLPYTAARRLLRKKPGGSESRRRRGCLCSCAQRMCPPPLSTLSLSFAIPRAAAAAAAACARLAACRPASGLAHAVQGRPLSRHTRRRVALLFTRQLSLAEGALSTQSGAARTHTHTSSVLSLSLSLCALLCERRGKLASPLARVESRCLGKAARAYGQLPLPLLSASQGREGAPRLRLARGAEYLSAGGGGGERIIN